MLSRATGSLLVIKALENERYVIKAYKLTVFEILRDSLYCMYCMYCHILRVRAIPTLESTDSTASHKC